MTPPPFFTSVWKFLATLRVEPLAFVGIFAMLTKQLAFQQMIQDKICLQRYQESEDTCLFLSESSSPNKNHILSDVTAFLTARELLGLIPSILTTVYIGAWCDKFISARRIIILFGLIGSIGDICLLLINSIAFDINVTFLYFTSIPTYLAGSGGAVIAFLSYITVNTKPEERAFRFLLMEVAIYFATSAAFFAGGVILSGKSVFLPSRMRNYSDVFLLALVLHVAMFVWTYFMVREKSPSERIEESGDEGLVSISFSNRVKSLLTLSHLTDSWKTLVRKREKNFHHTLWWIVVLMFLGNLPFMGILNIIFPLVQRVYNWDYVKFSQATTIQQIFKPVATLIAMPIIFKVFKMRDLEISITGFVSSILAMIGIASIVNPFGFFINLVVGSISGIGTVGIRSFLAKFISNDEITKVYSIVALVDSIQPFFGSWFYSTIFSASIEHYPTLVFHVIAAYLIICLIILCIMDVRWGDIKADSTDGKTQVSTVDSQYGSVSMSPSLQEQSTN